MNAVSFTIVCELDLWHRSMCAAGDPGTVVRWTGRVAPVVTLLTLSIRCSLVQWFTMQASRLILLLLLQTVTAQISINFSLDNLAAVAGGLGEAS